MATCAYLLLGERETSDRIQLMARVRLDSFDRVRGAWQRQTPNNESTEFFRTRRRQALQIKLGVLSTAKSKVYRTLYIHVPTAILSFQRDSSSYHPR